MIDKNDATVQVRIGGELWKLVENWRRSQDKIPRRSEAVRTLIEQALAPKQQTVEEQCA